VNVVTDGWDSEAPAASADGINGRRAGQPDDERLLAALGRAIRARRDVPPEFVQAAKDAFAWHDIDAELAQLTYDSVHGIELAARTRAENASIRALTFTSARLTIELEVTAESVLGQLLPTQVATIEIQTHGGVDSVVAADEIGCFSISPIPRGTFRLRCLATGGIDVRTGWISL
jgi:hypothetical protein